MSFNFLCILMIDETVTCAYFRLLWVVNVAFGIKSEKAKERKSERDLAGVCVYMCVQSLADSICRRDLW